MTDVIQHWDMQALVKNYLTKGRDGPSQYSSMFLEIEEISWQLLNGYFYFFFFLLLMPKSVNLSIFTKFEMGIFARLYNLNCQETFGGPKGFQTTSCLNPTALTSQPLFS